MDRVSTDWKAYLTHKLEESRAALGDRSWFAELCAEEPTALALGKQATLLEIVLLGEPTLRRVAEQVSTSMLGTPALRAYAESLKATMLDAQGVGLAAPQVADGLRCFAYWLPAGIEHPEAPQIGPQVLVNPVIRVKQPTLVEALEGCLSIPGLRGQVPRFQTIEVRAVDVEGNPLEFEASGFHARVIQHEFDHLDGVVYLDRMTSMLSLHFEEA
ncbi:MAG: peptide deformylase [Myxococcota bacterium]